VYIYMISRVRSTKRLTFAIITRATPRPENKLNIRRWDFDETLRNVN